MYDIIYSKQVKVSQKGSRKNNYQQHETCIWNEINIKLRFVNVFVYLKNS